MFPIWFPFAGNFIQDNTHSHSLSASSNPESCGWTKRITSDLFLLVDAGSKFDRCPSNPQGNSYPRSCTRLLGKGIECLIATQRLLDFSTNQQMLSTSSVFNAVTPCVGRNAREGEFQPNCHKLIGFKSETLPFFCRYVRMNRPCGHRDEAHRGIAVRTVRTGKTAFTSQLCYWLVLGQVCKSDWASVSLPGAQRLLYHQMSI